MKKIQNKLIELFNRYKHVWILSYFIIYLTWFGYLERTVTTHYHLIHLPIDDYIPFCEYFVIPYIMWFPIMILAGYEYGKEYIGAPVLGPIVFCVATIMMGILFDYVYEKTETIWLPSLMHGATNAFTIFAYLVKPDYSNMAILGPAYIGIISMIPMIIVAVIICVKTKRN